MHFLETAKSFFVEPPQLVTYLPGEAFFVQFLPVSGGSVLEDMALARLSLEGVSPFLPEQLAWGFFTIPGESQGCLYAAAKERLRSLDYPIRSSGLYWMPSFLAGIPSQPFEVNTARVLVWGTTVSLLFFGADKRMPTAIHSWRVKPGEDPLAVAFKAQTSDLTKNYSLEDAVLACTGAEGIDGDLYVYLDEHTTLGADPISLEPVISTYDPRLLMADVRDEGFRLAEIKRRKLDAALGKIACGLLIFIGILLVGEILRLGAGGLLYFREHKILTQNDAVEEVLEDQRLIEHIRHVDAYHLKPFELLDRLNSVRPKGLYFTQWTASDAFHVEVKGFGASVDQVNEYGAVLGNLPDIEAIELTDVQTRQGKVQFLAKIAFKLELKEPKPLESSSLEVTEESLLPEETSVEQPAVLPLPVNAPQPESIVEPSKVPAEVPVVKSSEANPNTPL